MGTHSPPKNGTGTALLKAAPDVLLIDADKVIAEGKKSRQTRQAARPFVVPRGKYRGHPLPEVPSESKSRLRGRELLVTPPHDV